jgi:excisionase family DNA binding protein
MPLQATLPLSVVNVPNDYFSMAGFEVTLHGRFWVTPEAIYLTLKEVAELLKVKPRTVYAWVSDNRIPFERKGSLLRFRLDAVVAWHEPAR